MEMRNPDLVGHWSSTSAWGASNSGSQAAGRRREKKSLSSSSETGMRGRRRDILPVFIIDVHVVVVFNQRFWTKSDA